MTFTVTTKREISDNQIAGLLCTALEGGSNYWYEITQITTGERDADLDEFWAKYDIYQAALSNNGFLVIEDMEDRDATPKHVNRATIQKGLDLFAEKYPKHFQDFLDENEDAITGDGFLQCVVFGDWVYG